MLLEALLKGAYLSSHDWWWCFGLLCLSKIWCRKEGEGERGGCQSVIGRESRVVICKAGGMTREMDEWENRRGLLFLTMYVLVKSWILETRGRANRRTIGQSTTTRKMKANEAAEHVYILKESWSSGRSSRRDVLPSVQPKIRSMTWSLNVIMTKKWFLTNLRTIAWGKSMLVLLCSSMAMAARQDDDEWWKKMNAGGLVGKLVKLTHTFISFDINRWPLCSLHNRNPRPKTNQQHHQIKQCLCLW